MLKKRIVAVLVVKEDIVVQSIGFHRYLPVGKPTIAVEFLNQWGIDEIILLDISASRRGRDPNFALVKSLARYCRVPLTVGGGLTSLDQIHELMHSGADKVVFNQTALHRPDLLTRAAQVFGSQCIVASIDARWAGSGYGVYDYLTGQTLGLSPFDHAGRLQTIGAGEILLNSVDHDGMKSGFDLDLINQTAAAVTVPLIVCGGAGVPAHFLDVLEQTSASAIAAANFFHFFEHSVTITKALTSQHHAIRHETLASYQDNDLDAMGRLLKKPDGILESLLYLKIAKEII
ncbi:MAG: imidazole glycerol phosphate synthase subunit HisF [Cylindrospermopsis raciborskii]|jgi:cyclase|uniref:imidazole glycerol phosphate synthase subunit HisF n=1 Tax=Cylindrospermopsis raciborskii TaxID=77022 RepID=UPI003D14D9A9